MKEYRLREEAKETKDKSQAYFQVAVFSNFTDNS